MRRFTRSIIAVGLAVLGMMATNTPPASAANAGSVTFSVILRTPALGYPGIDPTGGTGAIAVARTEACVGASVGKNPAAGTCDIQGAGDIAGGTLGGVLGGGAFCGHSAGTIWGTITVTTPTLGSVTASYHIHFVTAATLVEGTGQVTIGSQTGVVVLTANATPTGDPVLNPGAGSCATGTATEFRAVGEAAFETTGL